MDRPIIKRLKQILYLQKELQKVDLSLIATSHGKEPYQLTLAEFKACFLRAAVEQTKFGRYGKPNNVLYEAWHLEVTKAIIELKPGVAIQSLVDLRFGRQRKEVSKYVRYYQLRLE